MLFCAGEKWDAFVSTMQISPGMAQAIQERMQAGECFVDVCRTLLLDVERVSAVFADVYGSPYIELSKRRVILPAELSLREALRLHIAEVRENGVRYVVAPMPLSDELGKKLAKTGAFSFCYSDACAIDAGLLLSQLPQGDNAEGTVSMPLLQIDTAGSLLDVDGLIRELLWQALAERASDIHLEAGEVFTVALRVDGALRPYWRLPSSRHTALMNRLKLLSGMNIAEQILPQDGRFSVQNGTELIDVRTATMQTHDGEKMVLRLLPQTLRFHHLTELGLSAAAAETLSALSMEPHGLFVFSGPANSGKTTVLYTLLQEIVRRPLSVYSIEDPIESVVSGVQQIQINRLRTLDFATALRGVLRMDPDVLMIGELRDAVSAEIAVRAALTGHLVLATLHTYDAQSVVSRLEDLGVSRELIANALLAVCNQRLLAARCLHCAGSGVKDGLPCVYCGGRGRLGRTVVQECWQPDEAERSLIRSGADPLQLRKHAVQRGFLTLYDDAIEKAEAGRLADAVLRSALGGGTHDGDV